MDRSYALLRPVGREFAISQHFGDNPKLHPGGKGHTGVDFDAPTGTPVKAAAEGVVYAAGLDEISQKDPHQGYGWYVRLQHPEGFFTFYAQLSPEGILVKPGQPVQRGQVIAHSGESGLAIGPHLHFELCQEQRPDSCIDPEPFFITDDTPDPQPASSKAPDASNLPARRKAPAKRAVKKTDGPAPEFPGAVAEFSRGELSIRVALTSRPWALDHVDTLAVPAGNRFMMDGQFGKAWFEEIGATHAGQIRSLVKKQAEPSTQLPLSIELSGTAGERALPFAGSHPRWLVLVSASEPDGATQYRSLPRVARELIALGIQQGTRHLAMPLVGTGRGGLDPELAVGYLLEPLLGEIHLGGIQQITIATLLPEVVEAARHKFNLYRNNLAQTLANDEAVAADSLGIAPQVNALAETLMLRGMNPGVAVGILGSWGSGKTTVMRMIEAHIQERLKAEKRKGWEESHGEDQVSPYIGHYYPIWFNAWTFAKSNLWASLMDALFVTLDDQLSNKDAARSESGADLWTILRNRKRRAIEAKEEMEGELARLQAELKDQELAYRQTAMKVLGEQGQALARNVFKEEIKQVVSEHSPQHIQEILAKSEVSEDEVRELAEYLRSLNMLWTRLVKVAGENKRLFLSWIAISILTIALLAYGFWVFNASLAWAASLIPLALPPLRIAAGWGKQVEAYLESYQQRVENERRRLQGMADDWVAKAIAAGEKQVSQIVNKSDSPAKIEQALEDLTKKQKDGLKNLAAYQALLKIKEANLEQQRRRVGMTGNFVTLAEFVQARLDSGLYTRQLGMMHQIMLDVQNLTEGLAIDPRDPPEISQEKKRLFPRGPARVMLFIDDLDRCPPRRVVEVLEAVQLLLKTPLFIVVLGLDTRYATRALEKQYQDILVHEGDPSGLDYIEKILQIPYRVRPIEPQGLEAYLRSQMELVPEAPRRLPAQMSQEGPADGSPSTPPKPAERGKTAPAEGKPPAGPPPLQQKELPPEIVKFTQEDFQDIKACCSQVNLTPRSVKRLVNVLKLMEVYWFRTLGYDRSREIKESVIALLVLAAAYPEVMVEVFSQMEPYFVHPERKEQTLGKYFSGLSAESFRWSDHTQAVIKWQFERFRSDVIALQSLKVNDAESPMNFLSPTFEKFTLSTFNLTRSFSFIGDPSHTLDDGGDNAPE